MIGCLLTVDAHACNAVRGNYVRLCVQIFLQKPLLSFIFFDHHVQRIFYEGMHQIYFLCENIGHKNMPCPNFKHNLSSNQNPLIPEVPSESKTLHQEQIS